MSVSAAGPFQTSYCDNLYLATSSCTYKKVLFGASSRSTRLSAGAIRSLCLELDPKDMPFFVSTL